jgi:hypothetical protein
MSMDGFAIGHGDFHFSSAMLAYYTIQLLFCSLNLGVRGVRGVVGISFAEIHTSPSWQNTA